MKQFFLLLIPVMLGIAVGCQKGEKSNASARLIDASGKAQPLSRSLGTGPGEKAVNALFDPEVELVAASLPAAIKRGEKASLKLYWKIIDTLESDTKVFIHATVPGGEMPVFQADHPLPDPVERRAGDIVEDAFTLTVPKNFPADAVLLYTGLYRGRDRFEVERGEQDGKNRLKLGQLKVPDGPPSFPTLVAHKVSGPITIDGQLNEKDWEKAERSSEFINYAGKGRIRNKTTARILWDDAFLYVAFEASDKDVHTPYKDRDDPIYKNEAVEIFIDADGDRDEYVELQCAPDDVHFDAAFKGGRRKNFDTSYNVNYQTKTTVAGTLNNPEDTDMGWTSEWKIPIKELRDIPRPPKVGDTWQINMFRLDKIRKKRGDQWKNRTNEASAWSSPYSGDFHNLDRFGTLKFAPPASE